MGRLECVRDIFWLYVKPIDVIEPAVPSLGHHRQAPPVSGLIGCPMLNSPRDNRIARHADAVRVRNNDWSFKEAALINPRCAGHFAVAVERENAGVHRIVKRVMSTRENSGHASAHRTFANL